MALNRAVEINHGRGLPGTPLARPQAQRSRKGFVHRLLGKIKITEQADQSCQDSSRIHAIKGVEQFAYLLGGTLGHDDDLSKTGPKSSALNSMNLSWWRRRELNPWNSSEFLNDFAVLARFVRVVVRVARTLEETGMS